MEFFLFQHGAKHLRRHLGLVPPFVWNAHVLKSGTELQHFKQNTIFRPLSYLSTSKIAASEAKRMYHAFTDHVDDTTVIFTIMFVTQLWFFFESDTFVIFWATIFKRCFRQMYLAIFFQTFSKGQAHHQLYPTKIEIRLRWGYRTNLQKTSKTQFFQKISKPTILKSIKSW